ncbi:peptidoglycan editing factor PgeF [Arcobacter sp. FWKO B]|uniref:peptidoglycan editing factor PgeF n=1 Tax=Arcobacter sp. FWKO B TaxID=2593672 RepID=UPI0018A4957A|nr:peptidoglycan editing factor PgeF [Arcobacter sp. FWKO B]QOG11183.1 peptidoglycan editing factor PgeF [Arcobacter sp. FWKO B]
MYINLGQNIKAFYTTIDDGNMAYYTTDDKQSVDNNRTKIALKYDISLDRLKYMNQVHGNHIQVVDTLSPSMILECDGIITNETNLPLMVQVADCIGIMFYDGVIGVIGIAHAGRNGTFLDISSQMVAKMVDTFGSNPKDIKVNLSPSIQKCCYEVDAKMAEFVKSNFGSEFVNGRLIDLQGINKMQLIKRGIKEENITISKICTKCSNEPYFSYRNDSGCGRFAGVIVNS